MKKRVVTLLITAAAAIGFCACGDSGIVPYTSDTSSNNAAANTSQDGESDSDSSEYELLWWWEAIDWDSFEEKKGFDNYAFFDGAVTDAITLDVVDERFRISYKDEDNNSVYGKTSDLIGTISPTKGITAFWTQDGKTYYIYEMDDDFGAVAELNVVNYSDEDMDVQDCLNNGWWFLELDDSRQLNIWYDHSTMSYDVHGNAFERLFTMYGIPDYVGAFTNWDSYGFSHAPEVTISSNESIFIRDAFLVVYDYGDCVITYDELETNNYSAENSYYTSDFYQGGYMHIYNKECWEQESQSYLNSLVSEWLTPEEIQAL